MRLLRQPALKSTPGLPVIELALAITESNGVGTGNSLADLPANVFPTDNNTIIFDAAEYAGVGAAWRPLVFGQMEQQPQDKFGAGAGNKNATFTNTVGPWGRWNQVMRAVRGASPILGILPCMEGGGGFTDLSSRARLANYDPAFNDGAYNTMKTMFLAAFAALAGVYTIGSKTLYIELGGNDAINGLSGSAWRTKVDAMIAQLVTDGIISATDRIIFDRFSPFQTGIPTAARNANNAQIDAIVASNTARYSCFFTDGLYVLSAGIDPGQVHYTSGCQVARGEMMGFEHLQEWYPLKQNVLPGATATVLHEFRFGDYRNTINSSGLTSGALQTLWDSAGSGMALPTQATPGKQPAIGGFNLANGFPVRYASGDGISKCLVGAQATLLNRSTWAMSGVIKGASQTNGVLVGEGGATANPVVDVMLNLNGALQYLIQNDAGGTAGPATLKTGVFNGNWNRFLEYDNGTVDGTVNGAADTPLTYTRGTITLNRKSFFASHYNNDTAEIFFSTASAIILHEWSSIPDAALQAKLDIFYPRWCGAV